MATSEGIIDVIDSESGERLWKMIWKDYVKSLEQPYVLKCAGCPHCTPLYKMDELTL